MQSAERAKQRLTDDKYREAPRVMLIKQALEKTAQAGVADVGLLLAGEIDRLKQELDTTKKQLREMQISNANFRTQLMVLMPKGAAGAGEVDE